MTASNIRTRFSPKPRLVNFPLLHESPGDSYCLLRKLHPKTITVGRENLLPSSRIARHRRSNDPLNLIIRDLARSNIPDTIGKRQTNYPWSQSEQGSSSSKYQKTRTPVINPIISPRKSNLYPFHSLSPFSSNQNATPKLMRRVCKEGRCYSVCYSI